MKLIKFKKIDAFIKGRFGGNPAGIVYLDDENELSCAEMQQIAKELKGFVNEVVFLWPDLNDSLLFHLRYYSSECEVEFCGHGTIAAMYDLVKSSPNLLKEEILHIQTKNDSLLIRNKILGEDAIFITAPKPKYYNTKLEIHEVASALSVPISEINSRFPIEIINAGLNTLLVPIIHLKICLDLNPDFTALKEFCLKNNIDIIIIFTSETSNSINFRRSRVFAPKYGYLEDPATGSGNSAMGFYLLKYGLWDGNIISVEQGPDNNNPNIVKLYTEKAGNSKNTSEKELIKVLFGGNATVRIDGVYKLHK